MNADENSNIVIVPVANNLADQSQQREMRIIRDRIANVILHSHRNSSLFN